MRHYSCVVTYFKNMHTNSPVSAPDFDLELVPWVLYAGCPLLPQDGLNAERTSFTTLYIVYVIKIEIPLFLLHNMVTCKNQS